MTKTTVSALILAALCSSGVLAPAIAQELEHGTWSGTMAPPGAPPIPVTFEVGRTDGGLSIVMRSEQVEGDMPFQDVRVEGAELRFWWEPGVRVECALQRTGGGGFEGSCTAVSGPSGTGHITMVPPSEQQP